MKRYRKYYEQLEVLAQRKLESIMVGRHSSKKFEIEGYMPLSVEFVCWQHPKDSEEHGCISLCHYGLQNGDMMRDPEVMFRIHAAEKEAIPCYYRQDYLGIEQMIPYGYRSKSLDSFCDMWLRNLDSQGFLVLARRNENLDEVSL